LSGAICGYINAAENNSTIELGNKMISKLEIYKLDKICNIYEDNVFMSCGLLNIDYNFDLEILPFYDKDKKLIITADAVIYNKKEVAEKLCLEGDFKCITDSKLIIEAYKKWGEECPKYFIGDFSFAIWNIEEKELFCARDHTGNRTFYYRYDNERFCFSTLISPIISLYDNTEINEEWLVEYLSLPGAVHEMNSEHTLYMDVKQLPPASILKWKNDKIEIKKYWDPLKEIKELNLKSDEEYENEFKKVFFEAVHCRLDTNNNVGIMLSGGLDSGSIACIAAEKLKEVNKRLNGYSSIPLKGYKNEKVSDYYITDESEYIKELSLKYDNIDLNYCRCEGKSAITDIDKFIEILEQPYKIFTNIGWLDEIQEKAYNDGCRVLLKGQYGNSTISYGNLETHLKTLFSQGKFYSMYKEIIGISKVHKLPKKTAIKKSIRVLLPYKLRKIMSKTGKYNKLIVKDELIKKWKIYDKFEENQYYGEIPKYYTLDEMHKFIVKDSTFSHIGAVETKLSLYNGVSLRDPSRDKRIIEFCLSLPSDQFVRDGVERLLIRRYMKGILPDKIRLNMRKRGLQSADWIERLNGKYTDIFNTILNYMEIKCAKCYLDTDEIKTEIKNKMCEDNCNYDNLDKYITILIFLKFLKNSEFTFIL
jgi:asparagine synthase (glutamine-hydrolysing)